METSPRPLRVALIDLYNGEPNQGMRAMRELLTRADRRISGVPVNYEVFETRLHGDTPGLDFDVYLSSGGPGSPFDGEGTAWEAAYFGWLDKVWSHNTSASAPQKKHVLCICHSFQMMVRHFELARITERKSPSFGIFPVHKTEAGSNEELFRGLPNPFYAADFRHWQVVEPRESQFEALDAGILALEKARPHVPLERAVMAIRLSPEVVGVQFHPEADPPGMRVHFYDPTRRHAIVSQHGEAKFYRIVHRLEDPTYLSRTHYTVIPRFLRAAVRAQRPELSD